LIDEKWKTDDAKHLFERNEMPEIYSYQYLSNEHDQRQTHGQGQSDFQRCVIEFEESHNAPARYDNAQNEPEYDSHRSVNARHAQSEDDDVNQNQKL
jgi:hypothetical protein